MKKCSKCGYFELSKQERSIYMFLPGNSVQIAKFINSDRKTVLVVLRRLENYGMVEEIRTEGRNIIFQKVRRCQNCNNFSFLSAFNHFDCSISRHRCEGIHFYCDDYKPMKRNNYVR